MIIRIPFADSSAKLLSMLVKSGPGEQTASKIKLVRECITVEVHLLTFQVRKRG
jgi:hypothetical protein